MKQIKDGIYILISLISIIVLSFMGGYAFSQYKIRPLFSDLEKEKTTLEATARVDKISYEEAISRLGKENIRLAKIVKDYESRPEQIKYITRVETIIKGSETVVVPAEEGERPDSYTFELENGLPVARFESSEQDYSYVTYNLELSTDVVVGEDTATVLVTAYSSATPDKPYEMPSRISVKGLEEREHKVFEPKFYMGVTQSLSQALDYDIYASVGFPFIHLNEDVDVATPRVSFNSQSTAIGVDIVSWNAATKIPLLSDIWIAPGVSRRLDGNLYSADFTVGSRF